MLKKDTNAKETCTSKNINSSNETLEFDLTSSDINSLQTSIECSESLGSSPNIKAMQLISTKGENIILNSEAIEIIKKNFDLSKGLSVIANIGVVGTGKSTFCNAIEILFNKSFNGNYPFQTSNEMSSTTRGIYFYPLPFLRDQTQILLLDVEGLYGLREDDSTENEVAKSTDKLLLFTLMISSLIFLHSELRMTTETKDTLKKMCLLHEQLKGQFKCEFPKLKMLIKDQNQINYGKFESKNKFLNSLNVPNEFIQMIEILPRKIFPKNCFENFPKIKIYENIINSDYFKNLNYLFLEEEQTMKKNIINKDNIKLLGLIELIRNISENINKDEFEKYFYKHIDEFLYKIGICVINELKEKFKNELILTANNFDVNKSKTEFELVIKDKRNQFTKKFLELYESKFNKIYDNKEVKENLLEQLNNNLDSVNVALIFNERISEYNLKQLKEKNLRYEYEVNRMQNETQQLRNDISYIKDFNMQQSNNTTKELFSLINQLNNQKAAHSNETFRLKSDIDYLQNSSKNAKIEFDKQINKEREFYGQLIKEQENKYLEIEQKLDTLKIEKNKRKPGYKFKKRNLNKKINNDNNETETETFDMETDNLKLDKD